MMGPDPMMSTLLMSFLFGIKETWWCQNSFEDIQKKVLLRKQHLDVFNDLSTYFLWRTSEETDIFFLPLALRAASTLRPAEEAMRSMKPCLLRRFLLDG